MLDLAGLSDVQTFAVSVANENDQPFGSDGAFFVLSEDVPFASDLMESDEDEENAAIGEVLTFTLLDGPPGLVLDAGQRRIRWTPTQADVGPVTVQWRVADLAGLFWDSIWEFEVLERNDTPRISSVPRTSANEDYEYSYATAATDEEPGALTTTLVAGPAGMTIDAGNVLRFTPANADVGSHVVEIRVADAGGAAVVQRWTLSVANAPDAPVFSSTPVTAAAEDAAYLYDADVTDADAGETHTFSLVRRPAGMAIDTATGVVTWTPTQAQVGSHAVDVRVRDRDGIQVTQSFTIAVANTNDAPTITSTPPTAAGDHELYSYAIAASDPDPTDSFSYEVSGPAGMSVDAAGVVTWTPGAGDVGASFPVTVTVRDAAGAPVVQSFGVSVADVNNAPFFVSVPVTAVAPGATYAYDAETDDFDAGDTATFALAAGPAGMTVDPVTGVVEWTPVLPDEAGPNEVTLTATDAGGAVGTQHFTVDAQARPVADFAASKAMRVSSPGDGAHVVARENIAGQPSDDLLRGLNTTRTSALPASITIDLAGERAHALAALALRAPASALGYAVRDFELWVSETGSDPGDFTLAYTGTLAAGAALQEFPLDPVPSARFAKLVILSGHGPANDARLAELRLTTREHDGGVVSYAPGGASIVEASPHESTLGPERLLDRDRFTTWRTDGVAAGAFVTLELGGGAPTWVDRARIASGGGNEAAREVEIWTSSTGTAAPDFTLRAAATLPRDTEPHWIPFAPALARWVKLVVVSNHGEARVSLGEFHVFGSVGAETVAFDDLSIDPGGRVAAWSWDFGDGATSSERHPTHVYATPGVYDVALTVTDVDGFSETVTRPYQVFERPVASFTWAPGPIEGANAVFTDASTDADGSVDKWRWTVAGSRTVRPDTLPTASAFFDEDGAFDATLAVEDTQWIPASSTQTVAIANANPTADAGAPRTVVWGQPVLPRATIGDTLGDRDALSCSWDWGDGTETDVPECENGRTINGVDWLPGTAEPTHLYAAPGVYTATLTVLDDEGGVATDTTAFTVTTRGAHFAVVGAGPADAAGDGELVVRLVDAYDANVALAGMPVTLTVGAQSATVATDGAGTARASFGFASGANVATASFAGTPFYAPASESALFTASGFPGALAYGDAPAPDHLGTEFLLAFPPNYDDQGGWVDLFVASKLANLVTIEVPGLGYGPTSYALEPNVTRHIALPVEVRTGPTPGVIEQKAVRVTALHEVSVQAMDNIRWTTDGYLALPTSELGTEYLAASFPGLGYPEYHVDGTVSVAATADATQVTITPTANVAPGVDTPPSMPPGVPFTLTLDRGEILTLHAQALGADLSGTEITASAPIAVYGGHQCANVPTDEPYCDHLIEMLPPVATWGTAFVKAAYHERTDGDLVRVLASQDGTVVRLNGTPVATLDRGETWEREEPVQTFDVIETSAPALAWQFETGVQPYRIGDPSVALLTPIAQWPTEVWGYALPLRYRGIITSWGSGGPAAPTGFATSLNVVARTADLNGFMLDGAPLTARWVPIGDGTYAQARIALRDVSIESGQPFHLDHRAPGVRFGAWLSGLHQYDSFGYPLGTRLAPIGATCTPQPSVAGNGQDDDCDGAVDEELGDGTDQDGDGLVDEDLAAGQVAVNSAPVVGSFTLTTDEDMSADVILQGSDANGDPITFAITQPPAHGTLTGTPPVLRYLPEPDYPASGRSLDSFRYVANDGFSDSAPGTYTIAIRLVNDLPVITSTPPAAATEDALYAYALAWTDADAYDQGAVTFDAAPAGMAWNAATERIEWTPANEQVGAHAVTVRVTDRYAGSATQTFAVGVANTNDAPAITNAPERNTIAGGLYAYDAEASDVDLGDTLTWSLVTAPAGMAIDAGTGAISWTPTSADAGPHPVTVQARDAANATGTQSFDLEVDADTHAPVVSVVVQPERVDVGESATVTVLAIDEAAVASRQLTIAGSPISLNASYQATYTATTPGAVPIVATAIDPSGNLGMTTAALAVRDAADVTPPAVAIDTPEEDTEVTFATDVNGSATDTNLYKWTLARQFAGDDTWTEFAAGYQNVTAGLLGTLDPTLLENGIYLVRLRAEDVNGLATEVVRGLRIDGQAKIGIFLIDAPGGNGIDVTISIPAGQGDILGFFGNATPETLVPAMAVVDPTGLVTQWQFAANQVWKVGGGNVMSPVKSWDFGLRFASQGSAGGVVTSASFRLTAPGLTTASLTNASNQGWRFGIRIQSTRGPEGSAKIGVASTAPPVGEAPTIEITSPAEGSLLATSHVTVTGTLTGTAPVTVQVNGVAATLTGSTWSAALVLADGAHTMTATATNAAGSATDAVAITVDTTPPVVAITAPADGTLTTAGLATVMGMVADASPIASFTVNGVAVPLTAGAFTTTVSLAPGGNAITAEATDAAGNTGSAAINVIRGDAPTVAITAPTNDLLTTQSSIAVSGSVSGTTPVAVDVNGVAATVTDSSWTASAPLTEGTNTLAASATNAFGSASAAVSVTLDATPPVIAISAPADGTLTAATSIVVAGSVSDATSGVAGVTVNGVAATVDGGTFSATVPLSAGANSISAAATDVAGNGATTPAISVTRGEAPMIAITSPADGFLTAQTTVAVTGTLTGSPVPSVELNGVAATVSGGTFSASLTLAEGPNTLTATATNALGIASDSVSGKVDTTPPVVTITLPPDGQVTSEQPIGVFGTVADASPIVALSINGSALAPGNSFATAANLVPSSNPITVTATDAAGLVGSASVQVVFTAAGPLGIEITTPASMTVVSQDSIDVSGTVTDGTALVDVNGVPATVSGTSFTTRGVPLSLGSNVLVATAQRGSDLADDQVAVVYAVAPIVYIESPLDGATLTTVTTDVSGTVDDPTAFVTLNGVVASVDATGHFVALSVRLEPGPNELTALAENALGGRGTDMVAVTRQDDGAPKLRIVLVSIRPPFGFFASEGGVIIAEDVASFRAELAAVGDPASGFEPAVDIVDANANFPVHAYVFTDHAGQVSMPAAADFGVSDFEALRPIDELADDLSWIDLLDPSIPGRLLPWDFAPTFFARFPLQWSGGPE